MIVEIPLEAAFECSAERVFEVVADLCGQDRWLAQSKAFRGTVDVSDNPVRLGSTYREPTPQGVRHGEVIEFEPPVRITFHQPMSLRPFGRIDIVQRYTLEPQADATLVRRVAVIGIPACLRPLARIILSTTTRESGRTLSALKAYCETSVGP
jgi:uncharacterized protein YndB with AHSA1/START domain